MLDSPYAGLMPFTEEQAPFFFGRDNEREIIVANLTAAKLTLLYGPSGVGKSSVLNAGVVHQLRESAQVAAEHGRPSHVVVTFRNWRDEPLSALEATIERATGTTGSGRTFADRLDSVTAQIDGDLLIILDQFEEYFMYHPGEEAEGTFAVEFARAVNRRISRTSYLLSMREDSIAKLDFFKGRIPNLFDNYLRIDRLQREQAEEAIVKPVDQFNRLYEAQEGHYSIEPMLVNEVLDQVRANHLAHEDAGRGRIAAGDDRGIETPHLQLVMTRLWREERAGGSHRLRIETLHRLGGASEIVRRHVDSALDALTDEERDAAARIFQYLVTPAGTKIALGVEDLAPNANMSAGALKALLVKLSAGERRILTPVAPAPDQPSRERYQIFHDVLAEKILGWRTRYVAAAEQRQAEAIAAEERLKAEREALAASRLRRLLVAAVALLMVSVAAAWLAWQQTQRANAERRRADLASQSADLATIQANQAKAEAQQRAALLLGANAQADRLLAEKAYLEQSYKAAEAERQGKAAQAAALRQQAADEKLKADAAQRAEQKSKEDAAKAAAAAEAARIRREQLEAEIKKQAAAQPPPVDPVKDPDPRPAPPVDTPPPTPPSNAATNPPGPGPKPGPGPTVTPVGNYRGPFRQAMDAKNRRRWAESARLLEEAVQQNAADTGEQISISGAGNIEPYVPNYYLGIAYKNLGDCERALAAFSRSESAGAIQKTGLYKTLLKSREECTGGNRKAN